jgi:hypothetical protein
MRLPQHAALIYIIVVSDMQGQKADTENYQIAAAAPRREASLIQIEPRLSRIHKCHHPRKRMIQ